MSVALIYNDLTLSHPQSLLESVERHHPPKVYTFNILKGCLTDTNVGLDLCGGLLYMVWESILKLTRRDALTILILSMEETVPLFWQPNMFTKSSS